MSLLVISISCPFWAGPWTSWFLLCIGESQCSLLYYSFISKTVLHTLGHCSWLWASDKSENDAPNVACLRQMQVCHNLFNSCNNLFSMVLCLVAWFLFLHINIEISIDCFMLPNWQLICLWISWFHVYYHFSFQSTEGWHWAKDRIWDTCGDRASLVEFSEKKTDTSPRQREPLLLNCAWLIVGAPNFEIFLTIKNFRKPAKDCLPVRNKLQICKWL